MFRVIATEVFITKDFTKMVETAIVADYHMEVNAIKFAAHMESTSVNNPISDLNLGTLKYYKNIKIIKTYRVDTTKIYIDGPMAGLEFKQTAIYENEHQPVNLFNKLKQCTLEDPGYEAHESARYFVQFYYKDTRFTHDV